ncbi:hypothetical protein [uncultured Methylovirgula sp.]|uniref:hypothetical protein n=1 Tax=uncultured Methylovirgula sp. TaxID=1285960 RepID=UPI00262199D7|nr:hypothetical protein [uncultured Methylovirgula sp.]
MSDAYHGDDGPVLVRGFEGQDILRLALLSFAAVIAVALAIGFFMDAGQQAATPPAPPPSTPAAAGPPPPEPLMLARQSIEREIATKAPDYAVFFARLRATLPSEYDSILDGFAKEALDGKDLTNVDALLSEAVRDLRVSNGILAAKADGPALAHIFDIQLRMMQALAASDPKLCVDFLYGGASQAFFAFSASHRPLVADMAIAGLEAIGSGRVNGVERDAPSDSDFNALSSAMKAQGVNDAEVAAILDGKTPNPPIPDARMCTVGQIYLKTLAGLPEQARLRIYALAVSLMARS